MKYTLIAAFVIVACSSVFAQSGAALMLKPWEENTQVEFQAETLMFDSERGVDFNVGGAFPPAHIGKVDIHWFEAQGRTRLEPQRSAVTIGFEVSHLEFHPRGVDSAFGNMLDALRFPSRLKDYSVGVGFGIGDWEGWEVAATAGIGTAGDELGHARSRYGLANLIVSRELAEDMSLQFVLNYNGNRPFLPDVPLPGVAFNHRVSDTLWYSAGLPYSAINWELLPSVTLDAQYSFPYTLDARLGWRIIKPVEIFGAFHRRLQRYRYEDADFFVESHRRHLLFKQKRVEAGVRLIFCDNFDFTAAHGYAYDQELSMGWDNRESHTLFFIDDGAYWRIGAEVRF